ncbi:chromatin remodeling protein SHL-like protein isoform X2 [Tanacetum coccineum]|uniref:Chromatin remodeling protein SHL-like protein isoform X2 n=1 Tax=Tanacetum coccineum TaxID=301880 RepID=A0ABQ5CQZ4_9ASTR
MRSPNESKPSYIATVVEIYANNASHDHVTVRVKWYYRPEEVVGGRRKFHRVKEVFISDHFDVQSAGTIEGTCRVYGFKGYTKLDRVGDDEYFCRFEYASEKGEFIPDSMVVDWFHLACIDMNVDEDKRMEHFSVRVVCLMSRR